MIRWPNFNGKDRNPTDAVVSSLRDYSNPLDHARAESMADEGGASGAHVDAAGLEEVTAVVTRRVRGRRLGRGQARTWLVGAAVLGLAFAAGWWLRRRA